MKQTTHEWRHYYLRKNLCLDQLLHNSSSYDIFSSSENGKLADAIFLDVTIALDLVDVMLLMIHFVSGLS